MIVFQKLVTLLELLQFKHVILCPGARNALLIKSFCEAKKFQIWSNPDERSASFFGLGLSKNANACIVTTSGTAVSECMSAVIEAHYQNLPLMVISADRPKRYKNSGAPQAINQVRLFGQYAHYVEIEEDDFTMDIESLFESLRLIRGPIHFNIFCEDPKEKILKVDWKQFDERLKVISLNYQQKKNEDQKEISIQDQTDTNSKSQVFTCVNPIVIIGPINNVKERTMVQTWVDSLDKNIAVINESPSNIKSSNSVTSIDSLIIRHLQNHQIQSVIKIGGTPTATLWRVLDDRLSQIPVFNFSSAPYPGLSRKLERSGAISDLTCCQIEVTTEYPNILKQKEHLSKTKEQLIKSYPDSEISWFHCIRNMTQNSYVYLGNSLPIRYWDFVEGPTPNEVWANRGANGIDGQISSFLGWVLSHHDQTHPFVGIFGDLTAFYDMQAFWIYHKYKEQFELLDIQIWIINNQGGQIFQKLLQDPVFINQHSLRFDKLFEMFCILYHRFESFEKFDDSLLKFRGLKVIEVIPNMEQQKLFDQHWSKL